MIKYLAGREVDFKDEKSAIPFLATQGIDKIGFDFFNKVQSALELHIEDNKTIIYYEGRMVKGENINLPISSWEDHKLFFLEKNGTGPHRIGGKKPKELILPNSKRLKTPFQYIGTIDCKDKFFNWISVPKFHIVYPLYECNSGIFLNYTNPNEPKIINPETFNNAWFNPGMENLDLELVETRYMSTHRINIQKFENTDDLLLCGVPLWYQAPEIPTSPISNKLMRYVCTVNSDRKIKITNFDEARGNISDDYLIFGDYGKLFIFFEPETKVAHFNIQF